jgi:hypothetical protein
MGCPLFRAHAALRCPLEPLRVRPFPVESCCRPVLQQKFHAFCGAVGAGDHERRHAIQISSARIRAVVSQQLLREPEPTRRCEGIN